MAMNSYQWTVSNLDTGPVINGFLQQAQPCINMQYQTRQNFGHPMFVNGSLSDMTQNPNPSTHIYQTNDPMIMNSSRQFDSIHISNVDYQYDGAPTVINHDIMSYQDRLMSDQMIANQNTRVSSTSLDEELARYRHLDDHDHNPTIQSRNRATRKFIQIMQSIRFDRRVQEQSLRASNLGSNSDRDIEISDLDEETSIDDFSNFNSILKRHKKRFKSQQQIQQVAPSEEQHMLPSHRHH